MISNEVFREEKMAFHNVLREAFISTLTDRWDHFKTLDVDIDCESAWSSLFLFFGVLQNDHKNIITKGNLHQSNFPLNFQWDIIVRRSSLVNAFNLPDYGYEPWNSLHDFDEIFDRKFGKPAVGWSFADQVNDHCYTELQHKLNIHIIRCTKSFVILR